jgi:hypothetical protein
VLEGLENMHPRQIVGPRRIIRHSRWWFTQLASTVVSRLRLKSREHMLLSKVCCLRISPTVLHVLCCPPVCLAAIQLQ